MPQALQEPARQAIQPLEVKPATASGKRLLDISGAETFLSMSRKTIARHLQDDTLRPRFPRPLEIRGKRYWSVESLERWVERTIDKQNAG